MNTRPSPVATTMGVVPRIAQQFPDIPFDELPPGLSATAELYLSEEIVGEYLRLVGAPVREPVAPSVYCTFLPMFHALGGRMEQGTVHLTQRIRVLRPVFVGTLLSADVRVIEARRVGRRRRVVVEIVFRDGDTVACVSTGAYYTDMIHNEAVYRQFFPDTDNPNRADFERAALSMHTLPIAWVEPVDISNAIVWLASEESRYVTGSMIQVDAGFHLKHNVG
jgi:enoyl-ACP reductase-like protein